MDFIAAIAQVDSRVGDLKENVDRHLRMIERAKAAGASLVVFPELSLTGYSLRDLVWETALHPETSKMLQLLKEESKRISIALGFVESAPNHAIHNSAIFLEDGEIKHCHRKLYLPTYGMFEEGRYFSPGRTIQAFDSKLGRFGMLICEDLWHMSLPYLLAMDGAEVLLTLTASPTRISGTNAELDNAIVNYEHHRTYARLLSTYLLFANRVGFEDGVNFWGGSAVFTPEGETTSRAKYFEEDLIVSKISSTEIRRARRFSRHFLDENLELVHKKISQLIQTR
ncbi:MAG: nitrilase-related carbon-nitrogen hydrolase [bacterium]